MQIKLVQVVFMINLKFNKIKKVQLKLIKQMIKSQYSNKQVLQEIIHWIKLLEEFKVVCKQDQD